MFSDSQESDTQDFPQQVHSAHFNLLLLSDIWKQSLCVKAQAGTAEPTEASVQRYTEQYSPDPVDKVDDV